MILSDSIEGEARDVGSVHAAIAREVATRDRPFSEAGPDPVGRRDDGDAARQRQGRAQQRVFARLHDRHQRRSRTSCALAADTDGIDGSQDNAGAFGDGSSVMRMRAAGIDAKAKLAGNDAWSGLRRGRRYVRARVRPARM